MSETEMSNDEVTEMVKDRFGLLFAAFKQVFVWVHSQSSRERAQRAHFGDDKTVENWLTTNKLLGQYRRKAMSISDALEDNEEMRDLLDDFLLGGAISVPAYAVHTFSSMDSNAQFQFFLYLLNTIKS